MGFTIAVRRACAVLVGLSMAVAATVVPQAATEASSELHLSFPSVVADLGDFRMVDTRLSSSQPAYSGGPLATGQVITKGGFEAGAGLSLTVAAVAPPRAGYLTVYPCSDGTGGTSTVNFNAGQVVSNSLVIQADTYGRVCIQAIMPGANASEKAHVILDLNAILDNLRTDYPKPARLYDSRNSGNQRLNAGSVVTLGNQSYAKIYALNLVAITPSFDGVLTAYACNAGRTGAYSVAYEQGQVIAGNVLVRPDIDGNVCIYTSKATDLIIDRTSRISIQQTVMLPTPDLLVNSANGTGLSQSGPAKTFKFNLPADYDGRTASLSVQVSSASGPGFATVRNCHDNSTNTSNLNYDTTFIGVTQTFVSPSPTREVCITTLTTAHVKVYLHGYFNQRKSTSPPGCPDVNKVVWLPEYGNQIGCFLVPYNGSDGTGGYNAYLINNQFGFYWVLRTNEVVYFDRSVTSITFVTDSIICCGYNHPL